MGDEKKIESRVLTLNIDHYNMPIKCDKCGGIMVFQGCGEYRCEDCGNLMYDDYGKVRNYLDNHNGSSAVEVSEATGVSQKAIRMMLRDSRIEVAAGTQSFLYCEICGKPIRSGKYCNECEAKMHKQIEEQSRTGKKPDMQGFGSDYNIDANGERRFIRNKDK